MSSILTNNSAMVALQTLRSINSNMASTQSAISTGKSIATARDNAAVWAISKVMESDVKGFNAISSNLKLGQSTVAVARTAAEEVTTLLTQMKGRIVAAQQDNVDRGKIQTEVESIREQIRSVVNAAQFNGLNLVNGTAGSADVLASLDRDSGGAITSRSITVAALDLGSSPGAALAGFAAGAGVSAAADVFAVAVDDGGTANVTIDASAMTAGSRFVINLAGRQTSFSITQADLGATDRNEVIAAGIRNAIQGMGFGDAVGVDLSGADLTINNGTGADVAFSIRTESAGAGGLSGLEGINVSTQVGAQNALAEVEGMIQTAIGAASAFGSVQGRLDSQARFVSALSDALTSGIGGLVDADMEATSARLQALQVQQQLGIQALSIANQSAQNVLSLFR